MIAINIYNTPRFNQCQAGQSLTQYLVLMFVLTLGSLTAFGQFGHQSKHQVGQVALEISGQHGSAGSESANTDSSNTGNQSNSSYAGGNTTTANNPTAPTDTTTGSNPVTSPDGGNTSPSVPSNTPSSPVANNPVTNPSTSDAATTTNNDSDTEGSTENNTTTGQTNLGDDSTSTETIPEPLCTKEGSTEQAATPEEDQSQVKDEDKGFWGGLWDDIKEVAQDTIVAGYEFIKGFWEGMKNQIADLAELITNPKEVVAGLIELGKQFVKEPAKTAQMIADSLGDEFKTLALCGAYDKGRVIGANISPAFMVKFATKMASFGGNVRRALDDTKADFGCASFSADTPIWTPDGKVDIASLIKGNTVLSRNEKGFEDKPQLITNTFGRTADHYYQLTTEFDTINVTAEHPIWKQGRGWTEAQYLKVDDVVASADGDVLILNNNKIDNPLQVYNFSVDKTPSYFAGKSKLWVHNAACDRFDKLLGKDAMVKVDPEKFNANFTKVVQNLDLDEHIFKGTVKPVKNSDGSPKLNAEGKQVYTTSGVHTKIAIDGGTARIKPGTKSPPDAGPDDFYKAKVEVQTPDGDWKTKKNPSTFFPDSWDKAKIQAEIAYAMTNKVHDTGNRYKGTTTNGVTVYMHIEDGVVTSAYPSI